MKRMLINAAHREEYRVALIEGKKLYDIEIEQRTREQKRSNIYKGRITRVEPSLEAAFVDFGSERHGFLPLKEISREYFQKSAQDLDRRISIKDAVREGQQIIVQVEKEERGNKGAALTTFISLAGRYLVLMPNNPRAGGISRRIDGDDRSELKEVLSGLDIPPEMGVIIRTAGVNRNEEELRLDLDYLKKVASAIKAAAEQRNAPFLIYQESNIILRSIRDWMKPDINEIIIDNRQMFDDALEFIKNVMPHYEDRLKLFQESIPLFTYFQIESQIESAFQREVKLPSGGAIVIDPTEALVSIDINSARATKGSDLEETALNTNLEAADEIARQLRLRDIGGLIVIDFIDMTQTKNQREIENRIKVAMEIDRARIQIGRISRFGLLELSRQRLKPSLGETSAHTCPRCNGTGTVRDLHSFALSIARNIEEEAIKQDTGEITAQLPVEVATYLLNEKRNTILDIEQRYNIRVLLIPNAQYQTPHFELSRKRSESAQSEPIKKGSESQTMAQLEMALKQTQLNQRENAAVNLSQRSRHYGQKNTSSIAKFSSWFGSLFKTDQKPVFNTPEESSKPAEKKPRSSNNRNSNSRRRSQNRNDRNRNQQKRPDRNDNRDNRSKDDNRKEDARSDKDQNAQSKNNNQSQRKGRPSGNNRSNNRGNGRGNRGGNRRRGQRGGKDTQDQQENSQQPTTSAAEIQPATPAEDAQAKMASPAKAESAKSQSTDRQPETAPTTNPKASSNKDPKPQETTSTQEKAKPVQTQAPEAKQETPKPTATEPAKQKQEHTPPQRASNDPRVKRATEQSSESK